MQIGIGISLTGGGAAHAWDPTQLTSTVAWWDASQGVTQSGGLVSSWADRVGGFALTQSTGSLKPVYSATALNSAYPGVTSDGVDDDLEAAALAASAPSGAAAGWIFALTDQQSLAGDVTARAFLGYGDTSASGSSRNLNRAVSTLNRARAGDSGLNAQETTVDFSGINAVLGQFSSTTITARINGSEATAVWTPSTTTTRTRLFANTATTAASFYLGTIGHALIGTGTLTTADKEKLEAWALWSVGKQSQLPVGHTYKNQRP